MKLTKQVNEAVTWSATLSDMPGDDGRFVYQVKCGPNPWRTAYTVPVQAEERARIIDKLLGMGYIAG